MNLETKSLICSVALSGMMTGCATVAPAQLVQARDQYAATSNGPAAKLTPTELHEARKALDRANQEFEAHGDTAEVRDYAYIAARKTQLADVKARTEMDRERIAEAERLGRVAREEQAKDVRQELAETREELKDERSATRVADLKATTSAQARELDKSAARLEVESRARMAAESRLAGAMKDLAAIAAVKEDARGMVITLSGSVLFASTRYSLLETAKVRLNQVAEALKEQSSDMRMIVEGHTDALGPEEANLALTRNRANAVRDYLISRGVDASRISAVGMGSSRPIADNANEENRANNRRVEIVIHPAPLSLR